MQTKFLVGFPLSALSNTTGLKAFLSSFSDLIRSISDPEHRSMTLEQLAVVSAPQITVAPSRILIEFTPTVPHCGMSTLIGLSIRVRLLRALPTRFKVDIRVKPGSHQSEQAGLCGSVLSGRW
jgi:Iron-sulfur cluster assembly protein